MICWTSPIERDEPACGDLSEPVRPEPLIKVVLCLATLAMSLFVVLEIFGF